MMEAAISLCLGNNAKHVPQLIEIDMSVYAKDSVKFVEAMVITTSHEFMVSLSAKHQQQYFRLALDFLAQDVQKENIFSAVVHMDAKTPRRICTFALCRSRRTGVSVQRTSSATTQG